MSHIPCSQMPPRNFSAEELAACANDPMLTPHQRAYGVFQGHLYEASQKLHFFHSMFCPYSGDTLSLNPRQCPPDMRSCNETKAEHFALSKEEVSTAPNDPLVLEAKANGMPQYAVYRGHLYSHYVTGPRYIHDASCPLNPMEHAAAAPADGPSATALLHHPGDNPLIRQGLSLPAAFATASQQAPRTPHGDTRSAASLLQTTEPTASHLLPIQSHISHFSPPASLRPAGFATFSDQAPHTCHGDTMSAASLLQTIAPTASHSEAHLISGQFHPSSLSSPASLNIELQHEPSDSELGPIGDVAFRTPIEPNRSLRCGQIAVAIAALAILIIGILGATGVISMHLAGSGSLIAVGGISLILSASYEAIHRLSQITPFEYQGEHWDAYAED